MHLDLAVDEHEEFWYGYAIRLLLFQKNAKIDRYRTKSQVQIFPMTLEVGLSPSLNIWPWKMRPVGRRLVGKPRA